uniref:Putative ovule protein n=1 Tax=Solanum chacoense TaxID=4108 RepID=A0A0V0GSZ9_SOLCH
MFQIYPSKHFIALESFKFTLKADVTLVGQDNVKLHPCIHPHSQLKFLFAIFSRKTYITRFQGR